MRVASSMIIKYKIYTISAHEPFDAVAVIRDWQKCDPRVQAGGWWLVCRSLLTKIREMNEKGKI